MNPLFFIAVFFIALIVMIKGADWFLEGAEKIGLAMGMSPFIIGVVIVGLGTSFPELVSSLIATLQNQPDIAPANAIGSNIANILLVLGFAAQFAKDKKLQVNKSLIDLDIPLLASGTALFLFIAWDGQVVLLESIILLVTYGIYLLYSILHKDELEDDMAEQLLDEYQDQQKLPKEKSAFIFKDIVKLVVGVILLVIGAKYVIDSVVELAYVFNIAAGVIAVTAVAIGTSLPELLVSVRAAKSGRTEVAVGNIFGSNIFNMFMVVGIPGVFGTLVLDERTLMIGLPVLAVATFLFVISGISRKIYIWEGGFFLAIYLVFISKLFNIF